MRYSYASLLLATLTILSTSAYAQLSRTYVSGTGSDSNNCSRTSPCATWNAALAATAAGGYITALDSGDFGPMAIAQSVTVDGGAGTAIADGIKATLGSADSVTLRSLTAFSTEGIGVWIAGTGTANLMKMRVVAPSFGISTAGPVTIRDTVFEGTPGSNTGIYLIGTSTTTSILENVSVRGFSTGLGILGKVTAKNCDFSFNTTWGVYAAQALVNLDGNKILYNGTGVHADRSATIRLTNNTILDNGTGISTLNGGVIISFNDNRLKGNDADGTPSTTYFER